MSEMRNKKLILAVAVFLLCVNQSSAQFYRAPWENLKNYFNNQKNQKVTEVKNNPEESVVAVLAFLTLADADNYFLRQDRSRAEAGSGFIYKAPNRLDGGKRFEVITAAHVVESAAVVVIEVYGKKGEKALYVAYPQNIKIYSEWFEARKKNEDRFDLDLAILNFDVKKDDLGMPAESFPGAVRLGPISFARHDVSAVFRDYNKEQRRFELKTALGETKGITLNRGIETTCLINPGASGCPLHNYNNELIGVMVFSEKEGSTVHSFAVPTAFISVVARNGQSLSELRKKYDNKNE